MSTVDVVRCDSLATTNCNNCGSSVSCGTSIQVEITKKSSQTVSIVEAKVTPNNVYSGWLNADLFITYRVKTTLKKDNAKNTKTILVKLTVGSSYTMVDLSASTDWADAKFWFYSSLNAVVSLSSNIITLTAGETLQAGTEYKLLACQSV